MTAGTEAIATAPSEASSTIVQLAEIVSETIGPEVAEICFGGAIDPVKGEFRPDGTLSAEFAAAISVIVIANLIGLAMSIYHAGKK